VLLFAREFAYSQTNLECIGHVNDFQWGAFDVAISSHYAFLANGGDGLRIYDVSNPANPICIGHTNDAKPANALGIAVSGDYAYLATGDDGMRIYDVSDPTRPTCASHTPQIAMAQSFGIAVSGLQKMKSETLRSRLFGKSKKGAQYAYVANYDDGLRIFDVSNPAKPIQVSHVKDGGTALYATVVGKYVYLASEVAGLRIYDVSYPINPTNVATAKDIGYPWGAAIQGKYAYVAEDFYGLSIYEISNPAHPVNVGHTNDSPPRLPRHVDGRAAGIAVSGKYAYIANYGDGVHAYDISNPTNPVYIAHTATNYGGFSKRIAVSNGFAFVANANDGLRIYKVWNENPVAVKWKFPVHAAVIVAASVLLVLVAGLIWRNMSRLRGRGLPDASV
jgi:hypothetical protein